MEFQFRWVAPFYIKYIAEWEVKIVKHTHTDVKKTTKAGISWIYNLRNLLYNHHKWVHWEKYFFSYYPLIVIFLLCCTFTSVQIPPVIKKTLDGIGIAHNFSVSRVKYHLQKCYYYDHIECYLNLYQTFQSLIHIL